LSDVDTTGNGWDSSITINGITIMGKGGGGGCDGVGNGYDGGSGGGGASSSGNEDGGISTQETSYTGTDNNVSYTFTGYGNNGGRGRDDEIGGNTRAGDGGGGSGSTGNTSGNYNTDTRQVARISYGGDVGVGRQLDIIGFNVYYAGGGGGGIHNNGNDGSPGLGGSGIGGSGGNPGQNGENGTNWKVSGGGAGGGGVGAGGSGGAGIVIIRWKFTKPIQAQTISDEYKYISYWGFQFTLKHQTHCQNFLTLPHRALAFSNMKKFHKKRLLPEGKK